MDALNVLTAGVKSGRSLNQLRQVRQAAESNSEEFCARFDAAERTLQAQAALS